MVDEQLEEIADIEPERLLVLLRSFNYPDFWIHMLESEYWYWESSEFYKVEKA